MPNDVLDSMPYDVLDSIPNDVLDSIPNDAHDFIPNDVCMRTIAYQMMYACTLFHAKWCMPSHVCGCVCMHLDQSNLSRQYFVLYKYFHSFIGVGTCTQCTL